MLLTMFRATSNRMSYNTEKKYINTFIEQQLLKYTVNRISIMTSNFKVERKYVLLNICINQRKIKIHNMAK